MPDRNCIFNTSNLILFRDKAIAEEIRHRGSTWHPDVLRWCARDYMRLVISCSSISCTSINPPRRRDTRLRAKLASRLRGPLIKPCATAARTYEYLWSRFVHRKANCSSNHRFFERARVCYRYTFAYQYVYACALYNITCRSANIRLDIQNNDFIAR